MRRTVLIFLQYVAMVTAIGEQRVDLQLDTTPIFHGSPMHKFTHNESEILWKRCGTYNRQGASQLKINNGDAASVGQFPSTVYILTFFEDFGMVKYCTGTLISDRHVLTAGHCIVQEGQWVKPDGIYVHMGGVCKSDVGKCADSEYFDKSKFAKISKAKSYLRFKEYVGYQRGDVVVLELESPVEVSDRVAPACLSWYGEEYTAEQDVYANGFGRDESGVVSNDLRYFKTNLRDPSYDRSNRKLDCLYIKSQDCGPACTRMTDSGDSGSGLLSIVRGRVKVLGTLSGSNCYTDHRYYLDVLCNHLSICNNPA